MSYNWQALEQICRKFVRQKMAQDAAHDMAHVERVVANAKRLAKSETANLDVIVPAAWLHDIVNYPKNHPRRALASQDSANLARQFLIGHYVPDDLTDQIVHAIEAHSFSTDVTARTLEAQILRDADRLDALGAIGIARCFSVGGQLNRSMYHSFDPFCSVRDADDLAYTLDHFYQKLLRLEQDFCTTAGQAEASQRSQYLRGFLSQLSYEISLESV